MPALAEDRLKELTGSLSEYSEDSVAAAIEAAKDPDVARQFIDSLTAAVEDATMSDFTEVGLMVALGEARVADAAPALLQAAVAEMFDTTVYSDAAVYSLQRLGRPAFDEAMRFIETPTEDVAERIPAFDVLLAAADADARLRAQVADFCYARLDAEGTALTSQKRNSAYSCCEVLVFLKDERVRPFLERHISSRNDLSDLLDQLNGDRDSDVPATWRKPWQEVCPDFAADVEEFAEEQEETDSEDDETGLLDDPEVIARQEAFAKLVDEFNSSPQAAGPMSHPEAHRDDLKIIHGYGIEGVSPDFEFTNELNLREYFYEFLPRELLLVNDQVLRLIELLGAFIHFLHATGRLPNPEPLHRLLQKAAEEVPRLNEDRNNWGIEKTVRIVALSNGFDLDTKEGAKQFSEFFADRVAKLAPPETGASFEEQEEYAGDRTPFRRNAPKVGRNDPCPCGSGKKFKKCCGN